MLTAVKERPILFSGEMVGAILNGSKTQTRRVVKTPPKTKDFYLNGAGKWTKSKTGEWHDIAYDAEIVDGLAYFLVAGDQGWDGGIPCPYGKPGEILWTREAWARDLDHFIYRADGCWDDNKSIQWKPSIHMPRAASRILLEVADVRIQRVQDISEEDAIAEGAKRFDNLPSIHPWGQDPRWSMKQPKDTEECLINARFAFANYWNSINADRGYGWDLNPWVWCVSFKRLEP